MQEKYNRENELPFPNDELITNPSIFESNYDFSLNLTGSVNELLGFDDLNNHSVKPNDSTETILQLIRPQSKESSSQPQKTYSNSDDSSYCPSHSESDNETSIEDVALHTRKNNASANRKRKRHDERPSESEFEQNNQVEKQIKLSNESRDEKKRIRLELNRLAAQKCRDNKKKKMIELENAIHNMKESIKTISAETNNLLIENTNLKAEYLLLSNLIMQPENLHVFLPQNDSVQDNTLANDRSPSNTLLP